MTCKDVAWHCPRSWEIKTTFSGQGEIPNTTEYTLKLITDTNLNYGEIEVVTNNFFWEISQPYII